MAEPSRAGIITVSSVSEDEGWIVLLGLGADDDIVKQLIMLELLARVRAFLRRPGTEAAQTKGEPGSAICG